jgi:large subunit ribosomal protein LX
MSEVKIFRIKGRIVKPNYNTEFSKEIRATTPEGAVEKIYASFGSQHRVRRVHIRIGLIEEISPEESRDALIRELSEA